MAIRRLASVLVAIVVLAVSCGSGDRSGSVAVDASEARENAEPAFETVAVGDVPVGEMVAAEAADAGSGGLVLVAAGLDSLTVRWGDAVAPDATGFRLRWRPRRAGDEKDVWSAADLDASAREHTIEGLEAGWRYRLVLFAVGGDDVTEEVAAANFFTLATSVRNLSARATAHDAVRLRWRSPAGWSPVGYVVQWRRGTSRPFIGSASLPPGTREHLVTGLDSDARYVFRLTALTSRGWQSAPDAVRVRTRSAPASPLRLEVSVPAYCLAAEGRPDGGDFDPETLETVWDRVGVASVRLQWRLSGGTEPYTLTVLGTEHQGATGTVDVSCAKAGADFSDPEADIVSSGAKIFSIAAADAAGNTTTRTVNVEIIEDVDSAGHRIYGYRLQPGHIYSYRDRFFIEIPEGTRMGYAGSFLVHPTRDAPRDFPTAFNQFLAPSDPSRTTRLLIVEGTSREGPPEFSRHVCHVNEGGGSRCDILGAELTDAENEMWDRFLANIRTTPFPEGDPRNEPPAPLFPDLLRGQSSPAVPMCYSRDSALMADDTGRWLPYGALPANLLNLHGVPCEIAVGPHPSLLVGDPITVCVEGGARDGLLAPAITAATGEWNNLLAPNRTHPDPSMRLGLGYPPLAFNATDPACPIGLEHNDTGYIRVFDNRTCHANQATACTTHAGPAGTANSDTSGDPPRVRGNRTFVLAALATDHAGMGKELERILRHELAHFLGLADYDYGCWRLEDTGGAVDPSLMSYGPDAGGQPDGSADSSGCFSAAITDRDLADLHAIYHPPAVQNLTLAGDFVDRWLMRWDDSTLFPAEYNTTWTAVLRRSTFARDPATGALTEPPGPWTYLNHQTPNTRSYFFPITSDVAGFEYTAANMTRGDHLRLQGARGAGLGIEHSSLTLPGDQRPWGLGSESTTVTAAEPVGRYTLGFDGLSQVHFGEDRPGGWRFSVYGYSTTRHGIPLDAGDLLISRQPADTSEADPFDPANLAPFTLTYGATNLNVTACRTRSFRDGGYHCHITADLPLEPEAVPLRLVVATAPGTTRTSPLAGIHPVDRDIVGFVNYGATASGDWRFAFWGRTISGLQVTHGGPVTLRPGDIVISHARPWGPNGFADSPFAAGIFTPMRITYGDATIDAVGCSTHFYNVDRYECHVAGVFTFDTDDVPDHVAVNRRFTPRPQPPRAAGEERPPNPDATPTTCTTTPTTPCQPD